MTQVSLDGLVEVLNSIPERYFGFETVGDCLRTHPVDVSTLEPYRFFDSKQPRPNVILKNDLFELVAMCWEIGQKTPVQAYADSKVWGVMCEGRLQLRTFRIKSEKEDYCEVEETETFELKRLIAAISPDEPVHEWTNCVEYGQRAMSLHVFSPPPKTVTAYARNKRRRQRVDYETRDGRMLWRLN